MRRDMQEVLERWGRWAAHDENCASVDWPAMSVTPCRSPTRGGRTCSDNDGFLIDGCINRLSSRVNYDEVLYLGMRYIGGLSLRQIARAKATHGSGGQEVARRFGGVH